MTQTRMRARYDSWGSLWQDDLEGSPPRPAPQLRVVIFSRSSKRRSAADTEITT